jgi:hypothetical protein
VKGSPSIAGIPCYGTRGFKSRDDGEEAEGDEVAPRPRRVPWIGYSSSEYLNQESNIPTV